MTPSLQLVSRAASIATRIRGRERLKPSAENDFDPLIVAVAIEESPGCVHLTGAEKQQLRDLMAYEKVQLWDPDWDKTFQNELLLTDVARRLGEEYEIFCPTYVVRRVLGDKSLLMAQLSQSRGQVGNHLIYQSLYHYLGLPVDQPKRQVREAFYQKTVPDRIDHLGRAGGDGVPEEDVPRAKNRVFLELLGYTELDSDIGRHIDWPKHAPAPLIMGLTQLELCALHFDMERLTQTVRQMYIGPPVSQGESVPQKAIEMFDVLANSGFNTARECVSHLLSKHTYTVEQSFSTFCYVLERALRALSKWSAAM